MVANVDIRFAFLKIFTSEERVSNEREHAKDPRPKPKEPVANPGILSTNKERKDYAWKEDQHKYGEDQQNPKCEQFEKKRLDDFQNLPLKILRKF